jgi:hypothetical protein
MRGVIATRSTAITVLLLLMSTGYTRPVRHRDEQFKKPQREVNVTNTDNRRISGRTVAQPDIYCRLLFYQ